MKLEFFKRTAEDQATIIREVAANAAYPPLWLRKTSGFHGRLQCCLRIQSFGEQLVFKGGTSLVESLWRNRKIL